MKFIDLIGLASLSTLLPVFTSERAPTAPPCDPGWFGSRCQYKCHCDNSAYCDDDGECIGFSTCEKGWFGPSCQYVDLVSTYPANSTPDWVYDYPDTKCSIGQQSVAISLQDVFYFTWLRLRVNSPGTDQNYTIQFTTSISGQATQCTNLQSFPVSDVVLDIQCDPGVTFQQLILTGAGVRSLCSVYISGGRNVALKQETNQTTTLGVFTSDKAVDGNQNSYFDAGSCTHTDIYDSSPLWSLVFREPHRVTRYVLYNRDSYRERLRGFVLGAYQENGAVSFQYRDTSVTNHSIYTVVTNNPEMPFSRVEIKATYLDNLYGQILTLCEVELYGDTACTAGTYGRECEHACHCAKDGEKCFVSTGGCPSGCPAGSHGEGCQRTCSTTYFGENCAKKCSTNCMNQLCDAFNGTCLSCVSGKQGSLCDKACSPTYFGETCYQRCSTNCQNQLCDAANGTCLSCVAGKQGHLCDRDCGYNMYGPDCKFNCSQYCLQDETKNQLVCYYLTGACLLGCQDGYDGITCTRKVQTQGDTGVAVGIGVGVDVGMTLSTVVIVVGVYICRRKFQTRTPETKKPDEHPSARAVETEEHQYEMIQEPVDGYILPKATPSTTQSSSNPLCTKLEDTTYVYENVGAHQLT